MKKITYFTLQELFSAFAIPKDRTKIEGNTNTNLITKRFVRYNCLYLFI